MDDSQQIAVPLSMNIDLQLGPDGHPWLRYQIGTPALTCTFVIPCEHGETFIDRLVEGTRLTMKKAVAKQSDIVVPDFTGIAVANKNGLVESYEN
jgi:hypothetical protein